MDAKRNGFLGRVALLFLALLVAACQEHEPPMAPVTPHLPAFSNGDDPPANGPAIAVSAHEDLNCAIRLDRTLVCWGEPPVALDPPSGTFKQVDVGAVFGCAIREADETLACWGDNQYGQLDAPSGAFLQVSAGNVHVCAIRKEDSKVVCWGDSFGGKTAAPDGEFTQLSAGQSNTCAIRKDDRKVVCWGNDPNGRHNPPDEVFIQVASGQSHDCGIRTDGTLLCWGGTFSNDERVNAPAGRFTQVFAGDRHTCAIREEDSKVVCWGRVTEEKAMNPPDEPFIQVTAGEFHSCGIRTNGTVVCWGRNNEHQLDVPSHLASLDVTPPVIVPTITGARGQNGWYTSDVTVSWSVTDEEFNIIDRQGCETTTITSDTDEIILTCSATSIGGTASETVSIKRDATAPTLDPTVSPTPVLLNGTATATPNAADALSGLESASCEDVRTGAVGQYTVTCTATDKAGNTATIEASYHVTYAFEGFFAPVSNDMPNKVKAGQTVPLKWRLLDANGASITNLSGVRVTVLDLDCSLGATADLTDESAPGNSGLQNKGNGEYQLNWKTPREYAKSCKMLHLDLGEGITRTAVFHFEK